MNFFLLLIISGIISFVVGIIIFESRSVYNEVLAYKFFRLLKDKKFKKAFNVTQMILGKKIKAYLMLELVKALLMKNKVGQAYYIYKKNSNTFVKLLILELIIDNCIKNNDYNKVEDFSKLLNFYTTNRKNEIYKKIISFYEQNKRIDKIKEIEDLNIENLNFYVALSYIRLNSLEDIERIVSNINNSKKIGLLVYETYKVYRENNDLESLNKIYMSLKFDKEVQAIVDEFLIKIYIEQNNFEKAIEKFQNFDFKKQFDYYIEISKKLKNTQYMEDYLIKSYDLIKNFIHPTEKIMGLIKLSYVTMKEKDCETQNKYLDEAYEIYIKIKGESLDLTKEFILLYREYKKYEIFMELLEKKAKIYKEVISLDNMNEIKPEFIKSINIFLWGDELKVFEDFMKSYNIVQLKNGGLEYNEFYELIYQIKRYVTSDIFDNINKISLNLFDKPNTLYFVNQYLKILKESK